MKKTIGISLIEMMVSLLLLAILLLGLDAMQVTALYQTKNAYFYAIAEQQLKQMVERLMTCQAYSCDQEIIIWNKQNAEVLPHGKGKIQGYYPDYLITLWWGIQQEKLCHKNKIGRTGCLTIKLSLSSIMQ